MITTSSSSRRTALRAGTSILLVTLAALIALSTNIAWWATRTVFDTNTFVSTTESTMRQPEVQTALSNRIADAVITRGDIQARLSDRLSDGLQPLAAPLVEAERSVIQRAALRLLQSPRFQALMDRALRNAHSHIIAVLEDRGTILRTEGTAIVLDVQPLVSDVQQNLASTGHDTLLSQIQLPSDTGRIVLIQDAGGLRAASILAQHRRLIVAMFFAAAAVTAALAIFVAPDRRTALRRVGLALTVAGVVSVIALIASRFAVVSLARDETAARVAFDEFTYMLRWQSVGMMLTGLLIAGIAVLLGNSHAARAARAAVTHRDDVDPVAELQAARGPLIVGGLTVTTLILLAWPQPSARVYGAACLLFVLYAGTVVTLSSTTGWAARMRERLRQMWNQRPEAPDDAGRVRRFVVREDRELELAGVILALLALLFWPGVTTPARLLLTLAALLVWFVSIEWASASS